VTTAAIFGSFRSEPYMKLKQISGK